MLEQLLRDNPSITFAEAARIAQDDCDVSETEEICRAALTRWTSISEAEQQRFVKDRPTVREAKNFSEAECSRGHSGAHPPASTKASRWARSPCFWLAWRPAGRRAAYKTLRKHPTYLPVSDESGEPDEPVSGEPGEPGADAPCMPVRQ